jgi:DNA polymerase (family 10)
MDNLAIAQRLREHANHLDGQDGNLFRVRAYRQAALVVMGLDRPLSELIAEQGSEGLAALPGIGTHLAFTIEHLVRTGEFRTFEERASAGWRTGRTRVAG